MFFMIFRDFHGFLRFFSDFHVFLIFIIFQDFGGAGQYGGAIDLDSRELFSIRSQLWNRNQLLLSSPPANLPHGFGGQFI